MKSILKPLIKRKVKSYLRTDKPDWDRRIGFIAQDIQKTFPDAKLTDLTEKK